ncbi:hypothetical protein TBK1r_05890 [Stieleria magnilauensis]|uniref:Uncharacterized protein n=1 Tax=Stieleria magnilauensis TaxID=2527963 RepID=A0ABX5XL25_9BACT|nr:hypothetical protein TBK1r_05890 [Planctomycetes bacterium TBK1r]
MRYLITNETTVLYDAQSRPGPTRWRQAEESGELVIRLTKGPIVQDVDRDGNTVRFNPFEFFKTYGDQLSRETRRYFQCF